METSESDVIVIGLGGMGLACAHQLAEAGLSVIGFDQFAHGHTHGSSHGDSRIFRIAYFEHPAYVPLLEAAYQHWQDWSQAANHTLLTNTGLASFSHLADSTLIQGTLDSAATHQLPIQHFPIGQRSPWQQQLGFERNVSCVFEERAGRIDVPATLAFLEQTSQKNGTQLHWNTPVLSISQEDGHMLVQTNQHTYRANKVIITAGGWLGDFLPKPSPLTIEANYHFWFPLKHAGQGPKTAWAIETEQGFFYGFPSLDGKLMKINLHGSKEIIRSANPEDAAKACEENALNRVKTFISEWLPCVSPTLERSLRCLYTNTPDGNFIIDTHPDFEQVLLLGGFSGHGFKFLPVMGSLARDFVTGKTIPDHDGLFSLSRF